MKKIYILALFFISAAAQLMGQRNCGTTEYMHSMFEADPLYEQNLQNIEEFTQHWIATNGTGERNIVTIPVVVHVVYNTATENISDAQIASQITVLNNDFNKLNTDWTSTPAAFQGLVADVDISFCLATVSPTGAATSGVIRKSTTVTSFSTSTNNVKFNSTGGSDAWPASNYLNIWVCDIAGGILGYAQFPGGAASTDGVVVDFQYFGTTGTATPPFNKGRTATHEVGHWLNLYHIWGDDGTACTGSDLVSDTPNQADPNYGCPAFPQVSCSNGSNGDMFMNYMDYTDDACMYMFSNGQSARMQALFAAGGARASLLTSGGCGVANPCAAATGLSTSGITNTGATLNWAAVSGALSYNVRYKLTTSTTWINGTASGNSFAVTGLAACSNYEWQVQTVCSGGSSGFTASANFTTTGCTATCNSNYEENDVTTQAAAIPVNTDISSFICPAFDDDWFSFSNTTSQRHIRVTLTSVPPDYDIFLYNPSGVLVGSSQNAGTANETITYNNGPVGTYKVKVIGYNGTLSGTDSYILRAARKNTPYRLDGNDLDEGSDIALVQAYPNPTADKVNLVFVAAEMATVEIMVYDMIGQLVDVSRFSCEEGENTTSVNLEQRSSGFYTIVLRTSSGSATVRILKE